MTGKPHARLRTWPAFCALAGLLYFVRGLLVLGIYPPLEGFDETHHLAYVHYVAENHATPVMLESFVPPSLYPDLVSVPMPSINLKQFGVVGCRDYKRFYTTGPRPLDTSPRIMLYEAQHPPLYYVVTAPIYSALRSACGFLSAVHGLRIINLAMAALALVLLLLPLQDLMAHPGRARWAAVAIALYPMMLVYILRVANDAMSLLLAAAMVIVMVRWDPRRFWLLTVLLGVLLAAGAMTKTIAFLLAPVVLLHLFLAGRTGSQPSWTRSICGPALVVGIYLALCGAYHLDNLRRLHTPFPALETIVNARNGHSFFDMLSGIAPSHLWTFFIQRLVIGNLWTSGQSFFEAPVWTGYATAALLAVCFGGALVGWKRTTLADLWSRPRTRIVVLYMLIILFVFLGAYAHGLQCALAWGQINTPPYYVMVAFPALLSLAFMALERYGKPAVFHIVCGAMIALYLATEVYAYARIALPSWTAATNAGEMLDRTRMVHPVFPGPDAIPWLVVVWLALALAAGLLAVNQYPSPREPSSASRE